MLFTYCLFILFMHFVRQALKKRRDRQLNPNKTEIYKAEVSRRLLKRKEDSFSMHLSLLFFFLHLSLLFFLLASLTFILSPCISHFYSSFLHLSLLFFLQPFFSRCHFVNSLVGFLTSMLQQIE